MPTVSYTPQLWATVEGQRKSASRIRGRGRSRCTRFTKSWNPWVPSGWDVAYKKHIASDSWEISVKVASCMKNLGHPLQGHAKRSTPCFPNESHPKYSYGAQTLPFKSGWLSKHSIRGGSICGFWWFLWTLLLRGPEIASSSEALRCRPENAQISWLSFKAPRLCTCAFAPAFPAGSRTP
jgi:hypothetical protein